MIFMLLLVLRGCCWWHQGRTWWVDRRGVGHDVGGKNFGNNFGNNFEVVLVEF